MIILIYPDNSCSISRINYNLFFIQIRVSNVTLHGAFYNKF